MHSPKRGLYWFPSTSQGRWALCLFGFGAVLFGVWWLAIRIVWIAFDEPGGDAVRVSLTVTTLGAVGLAGAVGIIAALRGERALLVLLPIIPQLAVGAFVLTELFGGSGEQYTSVEIEVTFQNGGIELRRSGQDVSVIDGFVHVKFIARNLEDAPQRLGVMDLTKADLSGSLVQPFTPVTVPIADGRVRHYTYVDEPQIVFFKANGDFYKVAIGRDEEPPPRPDDISLALDADETGQIDEQDLTPGTTLVVFSDLPGRYEARQRAVLEIR